MMLRLAPLDIPRRSLSQAEAENYLPRISLVASNGPRESEL